MLQILRSGARVVSRPVRRRTWSLPLVAGLALVGLGLAMASRDKLALVAGLGPQFGFDSERGTRGTSITAGPAAVSPIPNSDGNYEFSVELQNNASRPICVLGIDAACDVGGCGRVDNLPQWVVSDRPTRLMGKVHWSSPKASACRLTLITNEFVGATVRITLNRPLSVSTKR